MTTAQLILIIVLVVVAAVIIALILRRAAARREERRVEAEVMRAQAREAAASLSAQDEFVEQAEDRAGVARAEAEAAARQAELLEGEAADQRATADASRRDYEATMRRADDIDPDVKESDFPPVPEADDGKPAAEQPEGARADQAEAGADDALPMTRAERRRAREEAEAAQDEESTWASGPAAPVAGAAAAAAVGTTTWAAQRGADGTDEDEARSARIASATDFRDDTDVSPSVAMGTQDGMSDSTEHDERPSGDAGADGSDGGTSTGLSMVTDTDAYAASEPVTAADSAAPVEPERPADTGVLGRETGSAEGEDSGPEDDLPEAGAAPDAGAEPSDVEKEGVDAVILADSTDYAATGPALADGSRAEPREETALAAEQGADDESVLEPGEDADAPASEVAEESTEERYDPTPERDWASDEGAMLAENRERAEELASDRASLTEESDGSPSEEPATEASRGRRLSEFHEIRDGGYGVGSAAPLEDGAQPLDHPVAAYRDTMTFRSPGDPGYDDADPDVWFYDEGAAERSGFHRSEG